MRRRGLDAPEPRARSLPVRAMRKAGPLARYDPLAGVHARGAAPPAAHAARRSTSSRCSTTRRGDVDAAAKLVTANLRLVVKLAYEYRRAHSNIMDLIQEGNIGLMQAVKKYDPYRGVKLSTYAAWWIRAYILRFILNNWRLVKLGTTQAQRKLFFNLKKEKARLSAMGIEPTPERSRSGSNVDRTKSWRWTGASSAGDMSLDAPLRGARTTARRAGSTCCRRAAAARRRARPTPSSTRSLARQARASSARRCSGKEDAHLRRAPARRGAAHAAGARRRVRRQPRARAPAREARCR